MNRAAVRFVRASRWNAVANGGTARSARGACSAGAVGRGDWPSAVAAPGRALADGADLGRPAVRALARRRRAPTAARLAERGARRVRWFGVARDDAVPRQRATPAR